MADLTYVSTFTDISVSAAQDLFTITTSSTTPIKLLWLRLSTEGQTTAAELRISISRLLPTITPGSGGTASTPVQKSQSVGTSTCAVEVNNTTRASATTKQLLWSESFQVLNGYEYLPIPECSDRVDGGQVLVVGLESVPAAATVMNGSICWAEAV